MRHSTSQYAKKNARWLAGLAVMLGLGFCMALGHLSGPDSRLCLLALSGCEGDVRDAAIKEAPPSEAPYRFAAFGDWGAGTPFQKDVAVQLAKTHQKSPFSHVLMLGDNIYPDGNVNRWGDAYFTRMYQPLIQAGVQFVVALGNHDVLKTYADDQIRFFHMPGYYYTVHPGDPDVQFFVLNTNTFGGDKVQQQWLAKALKESRASWKIVMGHHPIYSSGEHGNSSSLKKTLEPILDQYDVALYLAGHDHNYERFAPIRGVVHLVSGGAGAYLRDFEKIQPHSLVRKKVHHFMLFEQTGSALRLKVIDKQGQVVDQAEWQQAAPALPRPAAS